MKKTLSHTIFVAIFYLGLICMVSCSEKDREQPEKAKVVMREVGHQLLTAYGDSTSLVLPIIEKSPSRFSLSFETSLTVHPDSLVEIVKRTLNKSDLPASYLVEVLQCKDGLVAYSYAMKNNADKNIIPCLGRILPKDCYNIDLKFTKESNSYITTTGPIYLSLAFIGITIFFLYNKKENTEDKPNLKDEPIAIGNFKFYAEEHLLKLDEEETSLSRKECELLAIFADHPNQTIPRETLSKKVWEDQGVIVGRSLDTYISKLRKKLQVDPTIKLTNVHGIGYKLEVE